MEEMLRVISLCVVSFIFGGVIGTLLLALLMSGGKDDEDFGRK